jgi:hypothetical protein
LARASDESEIDCLTGKNLDALDANTHNVKEQGEMEARVGFEPTNGGFAVLRSRAK